MSTLTLEEAHLFNLLSSIFGRDNVIPNMSLAAVCGVEGEISPSGRGLSLSNELKPLNLRAINCLFTVVDRDNNPRVVIDFDGLSEKSSTIEAKRVECHATMKPLLKAAGIKFLTISQDEFAEILKPSGSIDLVTLLQGSLDDEHEDSIC